LAGLNDLPGGLTQIFWDRLQADSFASLAKSIENRAVTAKTVIGYCDSKSIHYFEGTVSGTIAENPAGNRDFQWDCVFIPNGFKKTFAELGHKKNEISMRRLALNKFAEFLQREK